MKGWNLIRKEALKILKRKQKEEDGNRRYTTFCILFVLFCGKWQRFVLIVF